MPTIPYNSDKSGVLGIYGIMGGLTTMMLYGGITRLLDVKPPDILVLLALLAGATAGAFYGYCTRC